MSKEILIQENITRFSFGIAYGNQTQRTILSTRNQDMVSTQIGIRHGITPKTEIFGRTTASHLYRRSTAEKSERRTKFNNLTLGINYSFLPEAKTPALLGYVEVEAMGNEGSTGRVNVVYGKTWRIGLTTYRSFDPVVLSLSAGYNHAQRRNYFHSGNHVVFDPGDGFYIQPSLSFSINNKISVSSGFQVIYSGKNKVDSEPTGIAFTRTNATMGVGFALDKKTTIFGNLSANVSGDEGSFVGLHITREIDW
ncbi:hypothetical protein SAMN02744784_04234 [Stenotrophomonas sp. CC120223-11]|nr:hypothetical protein N434_04917 [Rhizobium sp. UGM030330-04]SNY77990.1 hypothetical protein SAMN02744784_04234 [Stenotrophomonas sp. CC120223-11]